MHCIIRLSLTLCFVLVCVCGKGGFGASQPRTHGVDGGEIPVRRLDGGVGLPTSERINGKDVFNIESFPYVVGLYQRLGGREIYVCSGTVVHRNVVLSAAHCFLEFIPDSSYQVCYGIANLTKKNRICTPMVARKLQNSFNRDATTGPFDLALIKTKDRIDSPRTEIATVDFRLKSTKGKRAGFLLGFGPSASEPSERLRYLKAVHSRMELCVNHTNAKYFQCARSGKNSGLGGPCVGDSGGPLVEGPVHNPKHHRVLGVLSYTFIDSGGKLDLIL
ncbi:hypothetical protein NDN08_007618 [Rhodosorus marinus]|uniref:Peptidase S1 domain-containing protein n=1 Tax=Rhodosorus marinus TaxID=101924 RepID=A0AAV8V2A1_9RHOD|nr:hypothetical protein NDN08_007618 [Rhodosorus marinus]